VSENIVKAMSDLYGNVSFAKGGGGKSGGGKSGGGKSGGGKSGGGKSGSGGGKSANLQFDDPVNPYTKA
jgi:hypothetical protein